MWLSLNGMSSPSIRRAPVLGEHVGYRLIGVGDQVPVDAQRPRVARLCTWQPPTAPASGPFPRSHRSSPVDLDRFGRAAGGADQT